MANPFLTNPFLSQRALLAHLGPGRKTQPPPQPTSNRAAIVHMGLKQVPPTPPPVSGRAAIMRGGLVATKERWGNYSIKIYVRSFAPPRYFALHNWAGDNRGFSTTLGVTSRLTAITTYHISARRYSTERGAAESVALYGGDILAAISPTYVAGGSAGNGSGYGPALNIHLYGNDKAVIPYIAKTAAGRYQSPDIDVHVSLTTVTKDLRDGTHLLTITGQMTGDQFPAAEAFVDIRGTRVFLGVSPARYDPELNGPFAALFGDRQAPMATLFAQLIVNEYGEVMGVWKRGRAVDVDAYNRPFRDTNPVDLKANRREILRDIQKNEDEGVTYIGL